MRLDISKIKLLIVYVVYVCVVPELKLPSAFSESGWLAYDGPRGERHRGEAEKGCKHFSFPDKSDDETDKHNYRPISLLSVPGKLTESMVASTITTHVPGQGLGNPHQWAFDAILHSILLRMNSPATFSQYPLAQ